MDRGRKLGIAAAGKTRLIVTQKDSSYRSRDRVRRLTVLLLLVSASSFARSGVIELSVDASAAPKKLLHAHLAILAEPHRAAI